MGDLKFDVNNRGLTYILADYAKTVNGGKEIKMTVKQWEKTMKIVEEINKKRSADNVIYQGGSNLLGDVSKNFVLTQNTITFSNEEMDLILKEMGVKNVNAGQQKTADDIFEEKPIKGLSVERNPRNNPKTNEITSGSAAANDTGIQNMPDPSEKSDMRIRLENLAAKYEQFTNVYGVKNFSNDRMNPTIVTNAADTINLAPPFEIKIPKTGHRGGTTTTISHELHTKIMNIADKLHCDYEDLIAVLNFESGINPQEGAGKKNRPVGLIQFTSRAIIDLNKKYGLNHTKESIGKMSAEEQIDLVEKYLQMHMENAPRIRNKKKLDAADLYSLIILPGRAGRDILCRKGEKNSDGKLLNYYEANAGIDVGKDDIITRADVLAKLNEFRVNVVVV